MVVGSEKKSAFGATLIFNGQPVKVKTDIVIKGDYSYLNESDLVLKTEPVLQYTEEINIPIPGMDNLYLIHVKDSNKYKFGVSDDPLGKLSTLQEASPFELELVACCPNDTGLEDSFVKKYKWGIGGWYSLNKED